MPRGVSRYDEARMQGRLWDPRTLHGLALLCQATSLRAVDAGAPISQWDDESLFGNHLQLLAGSTAPAPRTVEGSVALRLTDDILINETLRGFNTSSFGPCTWIIVSRIAAASGPPFPQFRALMHVGNMATSPDSTFFFGTVAFSATEFDSDRRGILYSDSGSFLGAYLQTTNGAASIDTVRFNATAEIMDSFANGVANPFNPFLFSAGAGSVSRVALGGYKNGSGPVLDADVFALAYVARAISDHERELLEASIAWNAGIQRLLPANHRFANRPPLIGD
jgi:hypothetical protein